MLPKRHVTTVVVGAGVVGASVGYELARLGGEVLVLDAGETVGAGCSYANAGLVSPAHVEPLATPANALAGLRHLARPDGAFHLSPSPRLAPWLARFAAASTPRRAARLTASLQRLARDSLARHHEYVAAGIPTGLRPTGVLDVFLTERALAAASQRPRHPGERLLDAGGTRDAEPSLGEVAGALWREEDAVVDSRRFVRAVLDAAVGHGAEVRWRVRVRDVRPLGSGAVLDLGSSSLSCETVVIAAGVGARRLAARVGIRAPIEPGVGYVVDLPPAPRPRLPVLLAEAKVVATPYDDRLRLCGTLDLGADPTRPDPRRAAAVRRVAASGLPGTADVVPREQWAGGRPCTPDGVPMIGRSAAVPEVALAAGHGMWGVTLGPETGRLLAEQIVTGRPTGLEAAYAPDRFTTRRRRGRRTG